MQTKKRLTRLKSISRIILLILFFSLTGCGKKGPLYYPTSSIDNEINGKIYQTIEKSFSELLNTYQN